MLELIYSCHVTCGKATKRRSTICHEQTKDSHLYLRVDTEKGKERDRAYGFTMLMRCFFFFFRLSAGAFRGARGGAVG